MADNKYDVATAIEKLRKRGVKFNGIEMMISSPLGIKSLGAVDFLVDKGYIARYTKPKEN